MFGKIAAIVGPLAGLMGGLLEAVAAVGAGHCSRWWAWGSSWPPSWRFTAPGALNWGGINDIVHCRAVLAGHLPVEQELHL